jgi:hypothetical protein
MEGMKKKTTITTEKHEVWIIHPCSGAAGDPNAEIPVAELPSTKAVVPELEEESSSQPHAKQEQG